MPVRRRSAAPTTGMATPATPGRSINRPGTSLDGKTVAEVDQDNIDYSKFYNRLNKVGFGTVAGIGSLGFMPGGAFNPTAEAASNAATQGSIAASNAAIPAAVPGVPAGLGTPVGLSMPEVADGGGGGGLSGLLGKFSGRDLTSLILGGVSLLGGEPDYFQKKQPYTGAAAPQQTLEEALAAIKSLASSAAASGPPVLKNSVAPAGPAPVTIDGIPFQIGGGMGRDPALKDPSLLQGAAPPPNPFAGGTASTSQPGARRRPL
jgi:hypothetical protein